MELMVPEASIFTLGFLCQHPPSGHSSLCCGLGFLSKTNSYHVIALFGNPAWPLTASWKSHNSKDWQNQAFGTPSPLAVASHTTPPYSRIRAPAVRHVGLFTPLPPCLCFCCSLCWESSSLLLHVTSVFLRGLNVTTSVKLSLIHPGSYLLCPLHFTHS